MGAFCNPHVDVEVNMPIRPRGANQRLSIDKAFAFTATQKKETPAGEGFRFEKVKRECTTSKSTRPTTESSTVARASESRK
mmetsp:Transcript_8735/g.12742  ORF Transcript_8735/g.12742 Transcript_8735/m.12742 type:complete len:81 (-) Transcript_8735:556-798(-)